MFKEKKLQKLVQAEIITEEQKRQILAFDEGNKSSRIMSLFSLLGFLSVGLGIISLVGANWNAISGFTKFFVAFSIHIFVALKICVLKTEGKEDVAEKLLALFFLIIGATIGLIIQVLQLTGDNIYAPFGFWCLITIPLLYVSKKSYISYFYVPVLFTFIVTFAFKHWWTFFTGWKETCDLLVGISATFVVMSFLFCKFKIGNHFFVVLEKVSYSILYFFWFLSCFSFHMGFLFTRLLWLIGLSFFFYFTKNNRGLRKNVSFFAFWIFMVFVNCGYEFGLFQTGFGLIIGGILLLLFIKYGLPKILTFVPKDKNNEKC